MTKRLAQLVLMLSSTNDGEVVNAARAIGRSLQAEGKDWHALAEHIKAFGGSSKPKVEQEELEGTPEAMVSGLFAVRNGLPHKHREFIGQMQARIDLLGGLGRISKAQRAYIEGLYDQYLMRRK